MRKRLAWLFRYYGDACLAQAAIRIRLRPVKMTALARYWATRLDDPSGCAIDEAIAW